MNPHVSSPAAAKRREGYSDTEALIVDLRPLQQLTLPSAGDDTGR